MERIGVIGLGKMGSAIAKRFASRGHDVQGWTRSGRTIAGIDSAPDLTALVTRSDTLILSLLDNQAVAQMLDQLLQQDLTGKQVIDTSTVTPDLTKDRADAFAALGASVADAPISGGPELVLAGTCGVFLGADEATAPGRKRF